MFSIVIPVFNREKTVERAILSVFSQTYNQYELIIVDDGSTDKSLSVVKRILAERPNCKIISQPNKGVSSARNEGVLISKYPYIAFLDADDAWHFQYLEAMQKLVERHPEYNWWGCDYLKTTSIDIDAQQRVKRSYISLVNHSNVINYFEHSISRICVHINSVVISKSEILGVGGFPENIITGEDQDLYCRIAKKSELPYLPLQLTYYFQDADNRSCVSISKNKKDVPLFPFITENLHYIDRQLSPKDTKEYWIREYIIDRFILYNWRRFRFGYISRGEIIRNLIKCRRTTARRLLLIRCFLFCLIPRSWHKLLGKFYPKKYQASMTMRT